MDKWEIKQKDEANYKFRFVYTNPGAEAKTITYYVWLLDNNTIQISKDEGENALLNQDESEELLEVLTKN